MKIKPEHYSVLLESIRPLADKLPAHREFIRKEGKSKDVEMRLRWDALWASKIDGKASCFWISNVLYKDGLNDSHIDSALRAVMRELKVAE